jgi:hypothetical protein
MKEFHKVQEKVLSKATCEQLRIMRIKIATELESRLKLAESKYFKKRAIGER